MPTAGKLIGAILFAALAYYVTEQAKLALPAEGAGLTMLSPVNGVLGAILGWRVMGANAGQGFVPATGFGLTTIFAVTFWALLIWSAYTMIERAVSGRYKGPVDALLGMADMMLDNARVIVTPGVVGSAVIGSFICAMITEYFSRRWS